MTVDIRNLVEPNAVVRLCEHAAASMRAVSDLTRPDACGIEHPSEACRAVAALRLFTERLPSALAHLAIWFCEQVEHGRRRHRRRRTRRHRPTARSEASCTRRSCGTRSRSSTSSRTALDRAALALAHASTSQPIQR